MEEAEALCDKIGIINKGQLRCLGTQKVLKERFGQGYRLTINFK
jgi:ABC-type multidrug transport system ATPase subunit